MINLDALAGIIRRSLEAGQEVEIEGLGTFCITATGLSFTPQQAPQIFVAYAVEDLPQVRKLCEALRVEGFSPWLDKDKLLAGQNWPRAIERAIEVSAACVVCFSPRSVAKHGQFQSELRWALDCARRRPLDQAFVIPLRLEECTVPRRVAEQVQYVDLFPDWEKGVKRLARALRKAATNQPAARLGA